MRSRVMAWATVLLCLNGSMAWAADEKDALARARQLYNERRFDDAVVAADEARNAQTADSVDLVAARAYLERFRDTEEPEHLALARERLRRISPERLNGSEQLELLVGLGEELYLEGFAGAAADLFDTVFDTTAWMPDAARERVLDWWASALDHEARPRSDIDRQPIYQRIRDRMRGELGRKPASRVASYWLSAAAAGQGDHQTAWDAAMAGWVRAPLADDHGAALRSELDHLVSGQIVPQRARALAQPPDGVQQQWDDFKERWTK
jgi:hypothetical protein